MLAPFDTTVARVAEPDTVNGPGTMKRETQPGLIAFKDEAEGITVIYGHVRETGVEEGDAVQAGEVVAKEGNNGTSRGPRVPIGAWKGKMHLLGSKKGGPPLQVQMDLHAQQRHASQESGGRNQ